MVYSTDILKDRVNVIGKPIFVEGRFGMERKDGGSIPRWANVTWAKGAKALREGAVEAYDTIMIRMRWSDRVTRESQIEWDGRRWKIESFNASKHDDTIQMTCTELRDFEETTIPPESE